jgi:hypothetical protein
MELEYNELNDDWIQQFEKTDKLYQDFYKQDLYYTNIHYIYVNRINEIEKIKQESFLMSTPNYISREEILGLLKKNSIDNEKIYTILSILKYNITLDVEEITNFLNPNYDISKNQFLIPIKHIDAIKFDQSVHMFQDLNDLVFVFYEKSKELKKRDVNTMTKKIILIKNNNRKTIKKQYKD